MCHGQESWGARERCRRGWAADQSRKANLGGLMHGDYIDGDRALFLPLLGWAATPG